VLLLPIVLVAMDLVAREFAPVYYHNVLLIVVLVLFITSRDMVGVFGCWRVCYVVVACCCCKDFKQSTKMRKKDLRRGYCFYVLRTPNGHTAIKHTKEDDP
jgi:hypothetical protein